MAGLNNLLPSSLTASLGLNDFIGLVGLAFSLVGLVHAFIIRKSALARPWYSRWYIALPLIPFWPL